MNNYKRKKDESYIRYAKRLTNAVRNKSIDYTEFGNLLLGEKNVYSSENIRKFVYMFDLWLENLDEDTILTSEEITETMEKLKFEVMKERKKLQTVNNEYHKNARKEGRYEQFLENIERATSELQPVKIVNTTYKKDIDTETTGVLFISDAHYGRFVQMDGLDGETVNLYSTKEFETRMWNLLSQMDNDFYNMQIDKLSIIDCGDCVEGILRMGDSLRTLQTGVIESAIQYANFMTVWLSECQNRLKIPVEYSLTSGNHDVVRILTQKPVFEDETVGQFIYNHIKQRIDLSVKDAEIQALKKGEEFNNEQTIVIKPFKNVAFNSFYGMNVLAYHGETKDMKKDIEYFENYYNINIDILVGGHLHRGSSETIGYGFMGDREIVRVPSICGIDKYSHKLRALARAGAKFMTFDKNGKNWEKTYYLN